MTNELDEIKKKDSKNKHAWVGGILPLIVYGVIFVAVVILVIFKFRNSIF